MLPLILTACVDVGDTPYVVLRDPVQRLKQYYRALESWLTVPGIGPVIFVEGSSFYDLPDEILKRKDLHILWKNVSLLSAQYGKGRGEAELIQAAQEEFSFNYFLKCTGRLNLRDAGKIVSKIKGDRPCFQTWENWTDTRFFGCGAALWNDILPIARTCDDHANYCLERAVADTIKQKQIKPFWPRNVEFIGMSGTTGQVYGT